MQYVSIDIETTGTDPLVHDIIEFAAVIDRTESETPFDKLPVFHKFIKKNGPLACEPRAASMHHRIFKKLSEQPDECMFIEDLMYSFGNFLQDNGVEPNKYGQIVLNVAGKNFGVFDYQFMVAKIPKENWNNIIFRKRFLDPAILYFRNGDYCLPDLKVCTERSNYTSELSGIHCAVDDAMQVVKLMRGKIK